MRYSIEPTDRLYVKGYGFLYFTKNMSKQLMDKYGQNLPDTAKKSTTNTIKTASIRAIQKAAEAKGDLIGNTDISNANIGNADEITSVLKKSNKKLPNNEVDIERTTTRKRYISLEERQQITDELKLV